MSPMILAAITRGQRNAVASGRRLEASGIARRASTFGSREASAGGESKSARNRQWRFPRVNVSGCAREASSSGGSRVKRFIREAKSASAASAPACLSSAALSYRYLVMARRRHRLSAAWREGVENRRRPSNEARSSMPIIVSARLRKAHRDTSIAHVISGIKRLQLAA